MNRSLKITFLSTALAAFALPLAAQSTTQDPTQTTGQTIQERKENQQGRIAKGVDSGQLTAGEATKLEKNEQGINKEEHNMRQENGGTLTSADKQKINQQQNRLSNGIYDDKHNAVKQTTNPTSEVGKRAENQQDRIGQGVKSGQLTAGETKNLETNEGRINQEVHNDRAANGGKLTQQERQQVNRQQNKMSKQIYKDKHNARKQ